EPLTAVLVSGPTGGTLSLDPDGSFTYTPDPGVSGDDSFVYQAQGPDGSLSNPATVTILIGSQVQNPHLTVADASGNEGSPIPLTLAASPAVNDGSEVVTVTVSGLPDGATLSHGTAAGGVWILAPTDLPGLTVTVPDNGSFSITVTTTAQSVATGA